MLISHFTSISAQNYIANIKHWTIEDGLSHRQVNTIFQAKNGLIWIGTKNGLNSFNGYEFKHWLGWQGNVDTRDIYRIGQDSEGWLWLQRQDDLIFYHPKTGEFKTIIERFGADCPLLDFSASHYVQGFITDDFGRIYYEKYNAKFLYSYHLSEGFVKIDLPVDMRSLYTQIDISEDRLQLDIFYGIFGKIEFVRKSTTAKFEVKRVLQRNKNGLFEPISIKELLIKTDKMRDQFGQKNIQDGNSWLIKKKHLEVSDVNNTLLIKLKTDKYPNFKEKYLGQFFFDKNNKLWLSSDFGIYTIELTKEYFDFLPAPIYQNQQLAARGISVYNQNITTAFEPGIVSFYVNNEWQKIEEGDWLRSIYQEDLDEFWFGAYTEFIHWKDKTKTVFKLPKSPLAKFYDIWCIIPSLNNKNKFWLGTQLGLLEFDRETQTFTKFEKTNGLIKYYDFHIQTIVYDKQNKNYLWLCTNKGLILMDESKGFLKIYHEKNTSDDFLPATNFQHLYQDENNIFWLATAGEGLIKWQPNTKEYESFALANGFANEVIYAIYEDDFDNLWMSSDYGIIKMNKLSFNVENFLLENGIGQTEFNRISHFKTQDGTIYFGGLKGITRFQPKDFQQILTAKKSSLVLSNFQQFNGRERKVEQKTTKTKRNLNITLRPSDYIFDLQFSVLSYDNSDKNQYTFQFLENGDSSNNWQTQKTRSIQLGQLPYGNHTLIVKGKDAFGNNCENEIVLKINVLRPFYLQSWFIVLLLGAIVSGIYFYTTWRTRNFKYRQTILQTEIQKATQQIQSDKQTIEAQAEELKQLDRLKSTFFANVSHELRTPLTLMLAPIKSVLKRGGLDNRSFTFLRTAEQNGYQLLRLVNEILDLNKLEAGKLEVQESTIAFYPFIKRIASYFTSYSEDVSIDFYFNYRLEKDIHLRIDTKKVETVINNLLSNAFKFTPQNGQIKITIQDKNETIEIIVKDTGQGIHSNDLPNIFNRFYQSKENNIAEGGTGIGLALSQELAKLIGGDLTAESDNYGENSGSTFYFTFPKKEILKTFSDKDYEASQAKLEQKRTPKIAILNTNNASKPTILVVEDNSSLREYLKIILEEKYNITLANNGQEAIQGLTRSNSKENRLPSLIISDIMMPIMDGYQLLKSVKEHDKFRHIPMIMLTARAAKIDKLEALRIGVDDYILKPFDEDELLARIHNLLQNAQVRKVEKESNLVPKNTDKKNEIVLSERDSVWLKSLEQQILENIEKTDFTLELLAHELAISQRQLTRKVKLLTGLTPNKYITTIRLHKARALLLGDSNMTIKEVSYSVGFLKTTYFSKLFTAHFGVKPSKVREFS